MYVSQARSSTVSMPYRVQRIEEVVNQLEAGDLKLRVRVLEVLNHLLMVMQRWFYFIFQYIIHYFSYYQTRSFIQPLNLLNWKFYIYQSERAAKKATILQIATIRAVFGGSLLNLGVTLSGQAHKVLATGSFIGAGALMPFTKQCHYSPLSSNFIFINALVAWMSYYFLKCRSFLYTVSLVDAKSEGA